MESIVIDILGHYTLQFRYVPEEFKTKELCQLAFACDPWTLKSIPDRHKTPEMCLAAVKESGHLLKAVPDELKTREMCMIAVADGGRGLDAVPERLFDKEIALLAINNPETSAWRILGKIPERVRDYDVCLAAVTRSGDNLELNYIIDYGEICDAWEENWGEAGDDPFEVLKKTHGISFNIGSGWYGFHLWADEHCTDRVEIDWGSRAWKCKGKELIDLDGWGTTKVRDIESVDPDKTYGVVFIEMS